MRLALLAAVFAGSGAWTLGATVGIVPGPSQMWQAVTALGGDPANVSIVSLNPLQTYKNVMQQVTTSRGETPAGFHPSTVTLPPNSVQAMTTPNPGADIAKNGFNAANLSQVQQNNRHMEDMANYARNPSAWHGMPPH